MDLVDKNPFATWRSTCFQFLGRIKGEKRYHCSVLNQVQLLQASYGHFLLRAAGRDSPQSGCSKPIVLDENLRDCSEVLASGRNKSGVYTIWPKEHSTTGKPLKIYCDMETDGGGWT
ncbi:hypothetical protein AVEN_267168-1, partial [Araneus ventricosus]